MKFNKKKNVFYSCGIHPLYVKKNKNDFLSLENFSNIKKVIAIGETGLDYFHSKENIKYQQESFRKHIQIAKKIKKPIIVHSRSSIQDTIKILKEEKANDCRGILHSFSEKNIIYAKKLLDLGFYISFSGIITFNKTDELKKVLRYIPFESILIETDSPYLSPVPNRGKENQPSYLPYIAKQVAKIKKIDFENLVNITKKNFYELFPTINI
ncbi:MAG TPA: YchF/TatD family DNA exonuclease [Buchnera sp. (in: enterobacteria)]|nr:YchF/TatD family DNA exonuclease [Buchnera sp. (in: enterobacteria)]